MSMYIGLWMNLSFKKFVIIFVVSIFSRSDSVDVSQTFGSQVPDVEAIVVEPLNHLWLMSTMILPMCFLLSSYTSNASTKELWDYHDYLHTRWTLWSNTLSKRTHPLNAKVEDIWILGQMGFSITFSTIDHILPLRCLMNQLNPQKKRLYGCFVDFCRTFDTVWREHLRQLHALKVADYIIRGECERFNILITPVHILL
mgnify:CR=1 FL=1